MDTSPQPELFSTICGLIIDDDRFSRSFIKTALLQIGIKNVKEAANADEAREILNNFPINIILLDQIMPEQSGTEFVEQVKQNESQLLDNIPIIMITVDTQEKTVLDAKRLGIKEYLVKPISPNALKQRIINALTTKN